jgi:hypothetical protein
MVTSKHRFRLINRPPRYLMGDVMPHPSAMWPHKFLCQFQVIPANKVKFDSTARTIRCFMRFSRPTPTTRFPQYLKPTCPPAIDWIRPFEVLVKDKRDLILELKDLGGFELISTQVLADTQIRQRIVDLCYKFHFFLTFMDILSMQWI